MAASAEAELVAVMEEPLVAELEVLMEVEIKGPLATLKAAAARAGPRAAEGRGGAMVVGGAAMAGTTAGGVVTGVVLEAHPAVKNPTNSLWK